MMPRHGFKAVVLDLFDTLVRWEPERLPLMEWRGQSHRSTMPWVFPKLRELFGTALELGTFIEAYTSAIEEIALERERDRIEITCHERFRRTLERLGWTPPSEVDAVAEALTRTHMAGVRRVTSAPPERATAVRTISPHFRLGLLSNFDDTQTGHEVLADTGVAALFETVVISAEVRLRKPDQRIFDHLRALMGLEPQEILFVGDNPVDDILGASRAGMHTAWISRGTLTVPEGIPRPDFIIEDLACLPTILSL